MSIISFVRQRKTVISLARKGRFIQNKEIYPQSPCSFLRKMLFPSLVPLDFIPIWLYIFISVIKAVIK